MPRLCGLTVWSDPVTRFLRASLLALTSLLLTSPCTHAQSREAFADATAQLMRAAEGEFGDEGRYVIAAVDAMARALAGWDAALSSAETGLAGDVAAAPPPLAASRRVALAAAYLERGRFEDALEQLDLAMRLDAGFGEAYLLRGLVLERLGRTEAAAAAYRAAWPHQPRSLAAAYHVALMPAASDADRRAASNELLAALMDPARARRLVFPTDAFFDDGGATVPALALARYAPAVARIREGRYDDAVAALRVAAGADPLVAAPERSPDLLAAAGALRAGDSAGAIERLATVDPDPSPTSEAHRVLGLAHQASGDLNLAVKQLAAAIRVDPQNERARLALAGVLAKAGRVADARIALRDARASIPASGQAAWRLGQMAAAAGEWTEAVEAFEQAAAAGPLAGEGALQAMLARARSQQGDRDGAARALRARAAALPHNAAAHADLGGAYRAAGRLDAALVEYAAAVLLEPNHREARLALIDVLTALGRTEEARALKN